MTDDAQGEASPASEGAISPEDAFAPLADETRIDIVRALAAADDDQVGFNELRKRVGAKDSSGFNYHLRKLVGRFVRKGEDGYELTTAGSQVYGAILSGTYTDSVTLDRIELADSEDVCPECAGTLTATYEDERMTIGCGECDRVVARSVFPPAAVQGRSPDALPEAFGDYLRAMLAETRAGFCSVCSGRMRGELAVEPVSWKDDGGMALAVFECERCFNEVRASPGVVILTHPAVVSFFHERGVDVREVPPWRLRMLRDEAVTTVSEEPLRIAVEVERDGDVLAVTLDEDLAVVDVAGPTDADEG